MPVAAAVLLGLAVVLYLWGVHRADRWPTWRTACFLAGLVVIGVAVGGSVNAYSGVLFSMHMAQHLLLIAVAPVLVIFGRPLSLLRAATAGRARRVLAAVGRSRITGVVTHPFVAFALYAAVVAGTHLTPFLQGALTHPGLHAVEEVLYLASGYLLLLPVLGDPPARAALSPLLGLIMVFAGMVVDTVVGVALLMTPYEPFPAYAAIGRTWGPGLVEDLHWGGAAMWVGGDVLMAAVAIIVITRWVNAPDRGNDLGPWLEAARLSALGHDPASTQDIDNDEDALCAYNAMLARLASTEHRQSSRDDCV